MSLYHCKAYQQDGKIVTTGLLDGLVSKNPEPRGELVLAKSIEAPNVIAAKDTFLKMVESSCSAEPESGPQVVNQAQPSNTYRLGLLRRKEWLLRDRFEKATKGQKDAHDAKQPEPLSEDQMIDMELTMIDAQLDLDKEESKS